MYVFHGGDEPASFDAQSRAEEVRAASRKARMTAGDSSPRLDRAMLACEAMWSIMCEKLGVTDDDLLNRINDIDLSDGKLDGKIRKKPVACPKCNRTIPSRLPNCMYCGQAIMNDPFA